MRPQKIDWAVHKGEIEGHIANGEGLLKLARRYDVSVPGIKKVLKRLKLKTQRQHIGLS
jgi:Mor family transcriptional regulator